MQSEIKSLLEQNNSLIIPELGSLIKSLSTGKVNYNEYLKFNDGILREHLQDKLSLNKEDADKKIKLFVADVKQVINTNNSFEISGLGRFYRNPKGGIEFIQVDAKGKYPDNIPPASLPNEAIKPTETKEQKTPEKKSETKETKPTPPKIVEAKPLVAPIEKKPTVEPEKPPTPVSNTQANTPTPTRRPLFEILQEKEKQKESLPKTNLTTPQPATKQESKENTIEQAKPANPTKPANKKSGFFTGLFSSKKSKAKPKELSDKTSTKEPDKKPQTPVATTLINKPEKPIIPNTTEQKPTTTTETTKNQLKSATENKPETKVTEHKTTKPTKQKKVGLLTRLFGKSKKQATLKTEITNQNKTTSTKQSVNSKSDVMSGHGTETEQDPIAAKQMQDAIEEKHKKRALRGTIVFGLLAIIIIAIFQLTGSHRSTSEEKPAQEQEINAPKSNPETEPKQESEVKNDATETEDISSVSAKSLGIDPTQPSSESKIPVYKPTQKYYVVSASFGNEAKTKHLVRLLMIMDFDAVALKINENKYYACIGGYNSKTDAQNALASYKKQKPEAWLYESK